MKLVQRRERWTLTWPGRALVATLVAMIIVLSTRELNNFLSVNSPVGGDYLVVEGWMPAYAYRAAAARFQNGAYRKIIAAGVLHEDWDAGGDVRERSGAEKLVALGVPRERVAVASAAEAQRDRTFHAAMAVRSWLKQQGVGASSIDVITIGPHARRSRLLFEQALGDKVKVGTIALDDRRFDARSWWRSSAGVRMVIGELIAYVYARVFFTPD